MTSCGGLVSASLPRHFLLRLISFYVYTRRTPKRFFRASPFTYEFFDQFESNFLNENHETHIIRDTQRSFYDLLQESWRLSNFEIKRNVDKIYINLLVLPLFYLLLPFP